MHYAVCPGDELYGYMTLAKDWKDGVLSIIMRGMSKNFSDQVLGLHSTPNTSSISYGNSLPTTRVTRWQWPL